MADIPDHLVRAQSVWDERKLPGPKATRGAADIRD